MSAVLIVVLLVTGMWCKTPIQTTSDPKAQSQPAKRINLEALKKYVGRYELEVGIIPISTLDVTLENNDLWLKPSAIKKRRLVHKSKGVFMDEIAGTPCNFNKDDEGKIVSLTFEYEGAHYTAQKVILPPPALKGNTTFRLKGYSDANFVILAGTFNNWNQSQFVFGREGDEWVCRIDLDPGKYAYKFIVDGNWILDPANPTSEEDEAGNVNSVLVISREASTDRHSPHSVFLVSGVDINRSQAPFILSRYNRILNVRASLSLPPMSFVLSV